jgi:Protein of unknown function (DUF3293)
MNLVARVAHRFSLRTAFHRTVTAFGLKDLAQLSKKGRRFGVMSAYRSGLSKRENQERHGQLIADLQKEGHRHVSDLKSQWEDMATRVVHKEKSVLIPNISFKLLCALGKKYDQDAVLYKDPSETIGVYFKDGTAVMAFNPEGMPAMQQSLERSQEYSRGRSLSFGLQLVDDRKFQYGGYSGGTPVTSTQIAMSLAGHPMKP